MSNISVLETLSMADIKKFFESKNWNLKPLGSGRCAAELQSDKDITFVFKDSDEAVSKKFVMDFLSRYYEIDFETLTNEISTAFFDVVKIITKTPKNIDTILNSMQVLQSEAGSYITNILVPKGKPRSALIGIAIGLGEMQRSLSVSELTESGFIHGLNANTAQKIGEMCTNFGNIELKIKWNQQEVPREINTSESSFVLSPDLNKKLQLYSQSIAEKSPIKNVEFVGQIDEIKKLDVSNGDEEKTKTRVSIRATRVGDNQDAPSNVNRLLAYFGPDYHDIVFDAAKQNVTIYIKCNIIKSRKTWEITDVHRFEKTTIEELK